MKERDKYGNQIEAEKKKIGLNFLLITYNFETDSNNEIPNFQSQFYIQMTKLTIFGLNFI